jgi:hypothetical protein
MRKRDRRLRAGRIAQLPAEPAGHIGVEIDPPCSTSRITPSATTSFDTDATRTGSSRPEKPLRNEFP